jgi:transcriptional regulator with XRE-family HTH domain
MMIKHEFFGRRVRELRKIQGLSQELLAEKANLHYTYLGGIERGERNPSLKNIIKIAGALGVNVVMLFSGFTSDSDKERKDESAKLVGEINSVLTSKDLDTLKLINQCVKEFGSSGKTKR